MTLELREIHQSGRVKLLKIVLLNIALWTATFVGYGYLPELFSLDSRASSKIIALICMMPVFALVYSIFIGVKEQRILYADSDGIRYGGHISGFTYKSWKEVTKVQLGKSPKLIARGDVGSKNEVEIPLHGFGMAKADRDLLMLIAETHLSVNFPKAFQSR